MADREALDATYARLRNARREHMLSLYEEHGLSMGEIAAEFGISRQRVAQIIGRRGDGAHYGAAKQEKHRQLVVDAHERILVGSNIHDESARLGVTAPTLYSSFARLGLRLQKDSPQHGTTYRYRKGCRCDHCKAAVRIQKQKFRASGPKIHGTQSGYSNYGCRCIECRSAMREVRIRKRQEQIGATDAI